MSDEFFEKLQRFVKNEFPNGLALRISKHYYKINTGERVLTLRKWILLMNFLKKYGLIIHEIICHEEGTLGIIVGPVIEQLEGEE